MKNLEKNNAPEAMIESLVGQFLKARSGTEFNRSADGPHLDHDSLAAFTEGNLSEREAQPIVSHLADCSFCRHVTAELIRLDLAFADAPAPAPIAAAAEPSKISEVLSGLLSRIFGTSDGAVFAHNADSKAEEPEADNEGEEEERGGEKV